MKNDNVKFRNCVVILKGLIALLSPCCYYNQPWEVNTGELQYVLEFTLILLHVGNFSVSDNDEQLPLIEECLQSLCLVSLLFKTWSHKKVKYTQAICRPLPTNWLGVFGHFVGAGLKGLIFCFEWWMQRQWDTWQNILFYCLIKAIFLTPVSHRFTLSFTAYSKLSFYHCIGVALLVDKDLFKCYHKNTSSAAIINLEQI